MKFRCNSSKWEIEEIENYQMRIKAENDYTMGLTVYMEQKIYLAKEQGNIIKTLKHELAHVWLYEYGHAQNEKTEYDYEDICEIVACSNDFINEVVNEYKSEHQ